MRVDYLRTFAEICAKMPGKPVFTMPSFDIVEELPRFQIDEAARLVL